MNTLRRQATTTHVAFLILLICQAVTLLMFVSVQYKAVQLARESDALLAMAINPQQRLTVTSVEPVILTSTASLPNGISAHFVADIPIDTVVLIREEVPLPLPSVVVGFFKLAAPELTIPLEADVQLKTTIHVEQDVMLVIQDEIEFTTILPPYTTFPVALDGFQSPIYQQAKEVRSQLRSFAGSGYSSETAVE